MAAFCPHSYECGSVSNKGYVSFDIGPTPTYVSLVSSVLSLLGAVLIISAYYALPKPTRTTIRKIITLLALADLLNALGYTAGSINYLYFYLNSGKDLQCSVFEQICSIQSFVSTWFSLSSYVWTCILVLHFYLVIKYDWPRQRGSDMLAIYNVVAWTSPLVIVLPYLFAGRLGFSPYGASNWCFVKERDDKLRTFADSLALTFAGPLWVVLTYVIIAVFCCVVFWKLRIMRQYGSGSVYSKRRLKLLSIPILFILLSIWGIVQFFCSIAASDTVAVGGGNFCIHRHWQKAFFILGLFQAVGDVGQGWGNAILYMILFPKARNRLICDPFSQFCRQYYAMYRLPSNELVDSEDLSCERPPRDPILQYVRYPALQHHIQHTARAVDGVDSERERDGHVPTVKVSEGSRRTHRSEESHPLTEM